MPHFSVRRKPFPQSPSGYARGPLPQSPHPTGRARPLVQSPQCAGHAPLPQGFISF